MQLYQPFEQRHYFFNLAIICFVPLQVGLIALQVDISFAPTFIPNYIHPQRHLFLSHKKQLRNRPIFHHIIRRFHPKDVLPHEGSLKLHLDCICAFYVWPCLAWC